MVRTVPDLPGEPLFAPLAIEHLLLAGYFRNVPVDSAFIVKTLKNIQIVQSVSDDRLQWLYNFMQELPCGI